MSALFAFLHHVAAFVLVAAVGVQFVLVRGELTLGNARKLLATDAVYGMAAGVLLGVGLLRAFYFEKGAAYYFHSVPFIAKLTLFAAVGLLSIYPTRQFASWRAAVKEGRLPVVADRTIAAVRSILRFEVAAIVVILLCAALMARGAGFVG